jgi:hypothetical protein
MKRKAEEAEAKRKAEEAEKEKAAEALRIRAANEALQVGIETHKNHKKRVEEAARAEAMAFEMRRRKLAALGAMLDDPLMQVPEGPGPS